MGERQVKTPAERAQEDLDVATRVLEKTAARADRATKAYEKAKADAEARVTKTEIESDKANVDLAAAKKRVAFLSSHPDLPGNDGEMTPAEEDAADGPTAEEKLAALKEQAGVAEPNADADVL